ncbi:MAG: DNA-protecting protein DprA [Nitrospira bacterium HGW-Nitrospira-1]|nr:MAG: DNA-protecting protein DprA [Nitrospira bacterium HGW-Nitrospira-1]
MSDIRRWIGLCMVHDIGPVTGRKLLAAFGCPENVFKANASDLLSVNGISRERAGHIRKFCQWDEVEKYVRTMEKKGISAVPYQDDRYPEALKNIDDAPLVLYMKGEYHPDDRFAIGIVGSRKHTPYGESVTQRIAGELSAAGFTIISGLARGIDTLSHESALAAGGRTIAVLGSGPDVCYPPENRGLTERIAASGCVISEFVPGTMPNKENFPRRNRLISGLSLGVLVVEATDKSGSLITAGYALEQNKEVFSVPGNITSQNSEGTNKLIKQGAKIVLKTNDIIEELAPVLKGYIRTELKERVKLEGEENRLCSMLSMEPKHIDLILRESGLAVNQLLNLLLSLELKGIVKQAGGKRFYIA